jgi:hypothetical protein
MVINIALLCVTLGGTPQAATPATTNAVTASGAERVFERQEQKFSISRQGEKTLLRTLRNVGGALAGEERAELRSPQGIYTWLVAQPGWTLQLLLPSSEQVGFLEAPRFRLSDLRTNLPAVERALGGKITLGRRETFAGRPCQTLLVTNARTGRQQGIWLDIETGLILRHVDMVNGQKDYERWFTQFDPKASLPAATFQLPPDAKTIRGIPDAGILLHAAKRRSEQYHNDMSQTRQKTALGGGHWIYRLPEISGFEYTHTVHRERVGSLSKEALAKRASTNWNNNTVSLNFSDFMLDNIPVLTELPVLGRLFVNTSEVQGNLSGEGENMIVLGAQVQEGFRSASPNITFSARGRVIDRIARTEPVSWIATPLRDPSTLPKLFQEERQAGADAMVQSDFLDPKTGDTVSFLQLRHRGIASLFPGLELPNPTILNSKVRGRVQAYTLASPFPLNLITWQNEDGVYILASTRLTPKELLALAEQARH